MKRPDELFGHHEFAIEGRRALARRLEHDLREAVRPVLRDYGTRNVRFEHLRRRPFSTLNTSDDLAGCRSRA
jgi:molybdopterin-guanine dinucleotide biosynthesis protein A